MAVKTYRDLTVWQKAMDFAEQIYIATECFPKEEAYGLKSQLRRAAVSIPSNIAEGQARNSAADFIRFLNIAQGSRAEAETQILLAGRLGILKGEKTKDLLLNLEEISRMLFSLSESFVRRHLKTTR